MIKNKTVNTAALSVVIQAGGKSSRMNEKKPLMPFLGKPLIQRILFRVSSIADEILIVTNEPELYSFLNTRLVGDRIMGKGPISGLLAAMENTNYEYVAVVACDLPFLSKEILLVGMDLLSKTGADVAIPKNDKGFFEPLHAVYRRKTCQDAINRSIEMNQKRLISWFPFVNVVEISETQCKQYDPNGFAFFNINTKEDFILAEKIAKGY